MLLEARTVDEAEPARWTLMLVHLAGEPLPPPPELPGRKHAATPERRDAALAERVRLSRRTTGTSSWLRSVTKPREPAR